MTFLKKEMEQYTAFDTMLNQFDSTYYKIPEVIQELIADYLPTPDLEQLKAPVSVSMDKHLGIFKPLLDVRTLLDAVVHGKHATVLHMLQNNIDLIFKRGVVTDCSGRSFEHISAFEYALWALDKHMWTMMLACVPEGEEGYPILAKLRSQYENINKNGVTYTLNGTTIIQTHFDFENTIIKELQMQIDAIMPKANWDNLDRQWVEGVGGAQKLLPMHVVDEYCSVPFSPVPKFESKLKSSRLFYYWPAGKYVSWFDVDSELGTKFAVYKGYWNKISAVPMLWVVNPMFGVRDCSKGFSAVLADLIALKALCKIRTSDFTHLKSQLEERLHIPNNQPHSQ